MRRWSVAAALLGGPLAILVVLRAVPQWDLRWFSAQGHLVAVSAVALCASAAAATAGVAALRSDQPSLVWLGIGCAAVGLLMLGHGLTTPGVLGRPPNVWVGRLPYGAMSALAICLVAAARPSHWLPNRLIRSRPVLALVAPVVGMALLVGWVVADPASLGGAQRMRFEEDVMDVAAVVMIVMLLWVAGTHWRRWRLGHDVVQVAIVLAAAMAIAAVTAFEHGRFAQLSWWDYHVYLLAGFGGAVYVIFDRSRRERALADLLESAFVEDPFHHIVRGYPEALRSLVRAMEVKDRYTHGHSERTARLAVELGMRMRLSADRFRVLARGGYLHDVGKIGVPDHILNKPDALTAEERNVIEAHPNLGYELASCAPSLREVLPAILHHHERVDGTGYPAGLVGSQIPLEARVIAIADVWDALTSDRSYRRGWEPAQALAHIKAGRGTHFDAGVVDALVALLAERGIRLRSRHPGEAEEAWLAAQTCHELDSPTGDRVPAAT